MPYTDIFKSVEVKSSADKDPRSLVKLGLSVMSLAATARLRKQYRITKEDNTESTGGAFLYPTAAWQRRVAAHDVYLSLVDKRSNRAGLLLTVRAGTEKPGIEVVKVFIVNDDFANRGLVRVINQGYPDDVANQEIDSWQHSDVRWRMQTPAEVQRLDYTKALSTIYL